MEQARQYLLSAPDSQLDAQMKPYIEKWGTLPKTLEILEVLDYVIHGSLASGFVVTLLQVLLDQAIERVGTTYEAVVALASWRSELA